MPRDLNSTAWRGRMLSACVWAAASVPLATASALAAQFGGVAGTPVIATPDASGSRNGIIRVQAAAAAVQCDNSSSLGADAQLRVTQQKGRALIEILKPNSAGRKVDIEYGDELYSQKFGADGRLRAGFALTAASNQFSINMSEAAPINCTANVPDFNKYYRVILRWHDPVQLDLHVIEPGGRQGEAGYVNGSRPNTNLNQGIGQMDVIGGVPAEGATGEMSYVVADAAAIPPNTVFSYKIDYVTRGNQPESPYCDDNALAAPQVEFITIENGLINTRKLSLNHARCREKIPEARRLMPIRQ